MENKIIVGVSGGPDSIYLLNKLYNEKKHTLIVVHVNYHLRESSNEDQKLVKEFCESKKIKLIIKEVSQEDWNFFSSLKNKQSIAREIRYKEYFSAALKNNAKDIFLAHHADDWLETALMQKNRSDVLLYFGIKEKTLFKDFIINRPLLNIFKQDILNFLNIENIKYITDETNLMPIYDRNRKRIELLNFTIEQKIQMIKEFEQINTKKEKQYNEINFLYNKLIESNLDWNVFNIIEEKNKIYIVYKILINFEKRINISSKKIEGIIIFLKNKNINKSYRLMENIFITVKSSKILLYVKNGNRK